MKNFYKSIKPFALAIGLVCVLAAGTALILKSAWAAWEGTSIIISDVKYEGMSTETYTTYHGEAHTLTSDYYIVIPEEYPFEQIELYASSYCLSGLTFDVCGDKSSCRVDVTPGEKLEFMVTFTTDTSCDPGSKGYIEAWHKIGALVVQDGDGGGDDGPVCGNGSCESGETCSNCSSDCGACPPPPGSGSTDGSACSSNSDCASGYCGSKGVCCAEDKWCCNQDSQCADTSYCDFNTYICHTKKLGGLFGGSCDRARQCLGGYCVHGECSYEPTVCGDDYCDPGESSLTCESDCGKIYKEDGQACEFASDCKSDYCVHNFCRAESEYCGDGYCEGPEDCSTCSRDCGNCKANGSLCTRDVECAAEYCLHGYCRSENTFCGDDYCDTGEIYLTCPEDCEKKVSVDPDLRVSFSSGELTLTPGRVHGFVLNYKNEGKAAANNIITKIYIDSPDVLEVVNEVDVGDLEFGQELSKTLNLKAKKAGVARLILSTRGDNFASVNKQLRVEIETALVLDAAPDPIFLQLSQTKELDITLANQSYGPIKVAALTVESLDPSIVSVERGASMEVRGQGDGIEPDDLFATWSDQTLHGIDPKPEILTRANGETELVVKLDYFYPDDISKGHEIIEKKIKVKVGDLNGGQTADLEMEILPHGLILEKGEVREAKIVLKNHGSEIIDRGKIMIHSSDSIYFDSTDQISFGYLYPDEQAEAVIKVKALNLLPIELEEMTKYGALSINGKLIFDGEYATADGREFSFTDDMSVALVGGRARCLPGDSKCQQAVDCLINISNFLGCALEIADIIPYFDKPIAGALAVSDICEIGARLDSDDTIGAAIKTALFASDVTDNLGEAAPGPGNVGSVFADIVEGAADCAEGFVYSALDDYCSAGATRGGYSGCAANLFAMFADASANRRELGDADKFVVAIVGSPVSIKIVDADGNELPSSAGAMVMQQGDMKLALVKNPGDLANGFNFRLVGQNDGEYSVYLALVDDGKLVKKQEIKNQPISQDQSVNIPMRVNATPNGEGDLLVGEQIDWARKNLNGLIITGVTLLLLIILGIIFIVLQKRGGKKIELLILGLVIIFFLAAGALMQVFDIEFSTITALFSEPPPSPAKEAPPAAVQEEPAPESQCQSVDLSTGFSTYYFTQVERTCNEYFNSIGTAGFSSRCATGAGAYYRIHYVKEIDVSAYDRVTIKANLGISQHAADSSAGCTNHAAVDKNDYVKLFVLESDPREKLAQECDRAVPEYAWSACTIDQEYGAILSACGLPSCTDAKQCSIPLDVSGKDKIYLVFQAMDERVKLDIEGALSNVELCDILESGD
ncbi:hypothetical protein KJ969_02425 [Patescibacteria group bacterium]|nr:hypothetical protein [Patescibacteria group bacterium]MBU1921642.1 hypothetical protein [Patescibacteria group bacterium]